MRKRKNFMKFLAVSSACVLGIANCLYPIHAEQTTDVEYIKGRKLTETEIREMKSHEPKTFQKLDDSIKVPVYKKVSSARMLDSTTGNQALSHATATLPSYYNAVEHGNVTSVKDQNPWGDCWAFGCLCSLESSTIAQGITVNNQLATASNTDLSERQLAYFAYNTVADPMGNTWGDSSYVTNNNYLDIGGSEYRTMFELGSWVGAKNEQVARYQELIGVDASDLGRYDLNSSKAYNPDVVMKDAIQINFANRNEIKEMIRQFGSGAITFNWNSMNYNYDTAAYYDSYSTYTNHLVSVVGWDDNYSNSNFIDTPAHNGAWLVKNSWGGEWGRYGYFWISYDDARVSETSGNHATFFISQSADTYDNNYQYDGSLSCIYTYLPSGGSAANRFVVPSDSNGEILKAVSFATNSANVSYSIQIYKNGNTYSPVSGTPQFATEQTGSVSYAGYHTIPLNQQVSLSAGDSFSVVITFDSLQGDSSVDLYTDMTVTDEYSNGSITSVNHIQYGESFLKMGRNAFWADVMESGYERTPRIKAFTVNAGSQPTPTPTPTPTSRPQTQTVTHSFTTDGLTSSTFAITGNLSNKKGTIVYNGMTLTQCLKMESITDVSFTTPGNGRITLICGDASNGYDIKIDGNNYTVSNGQVSVDLGAGEHHITKSNKNVVVYYMILNK